MISGTHILKEIRYYQQRTEVVIPRAAFLRVVRSVARQYMAEAKFQVAAIMALQVTISFECWKICILVAMRNLSM